MNLLLYRRSSVVCLSVCLSVTIVSPAITAEPIEMPSMGCGLGFDPRNHVLDGVQIPTCEGTILTAKRGQLRTCPDSGQHTLSDSVGGSTGTVRMPIGCTRWGWVHIVATWWIQLNRPCAATIRRYVKSLWPFVSFAPVEVRRSHLAPFAK